MYSNEKEQLLKDIDELINSKNNKKNKAKLLEIRNKLAASNDDSFILQMTEKLIKVISTPSKVYSLYRLLKNLWDWLKHVF